MFGRRGIAGCRLRSLQGGVLFGICTVVATALGGCATLERLPAVTYAQAKQVEILDIPDARFYVSESKQILDMAIKANQRRNMTRGVSATRNFLAISGGGDDGAFGAGLLVGWSDRGDRPEFDVVTGVSTGSLSAPFVFLGRPYDPQLKAVYTETSASDVFERNALLGALTGDALTNNAPLRAMISRYLDDEMIRRIGEEYGKGRLLFILTTNLDQARPVIWNIGAIAASNNPKARELIIDVLLASTSIPVVFPPVMLDVTVDGQRHQEMHVDGGTIAQAFLYPPSISLRTGAARAGINEKTLRTERKRVAYVIRNGRFTRPEESVQLRTIAIAKEALSTMTASSGVNDTYRMFLLARRDGVSFNLASISDDFDVPYKGPFNEEYMRSLYDYGYRKARAGYPWQKAPPGYVN